MGGRWRWTLGALALVVALLLLLRPRPVDEVPTVRAAPTTSSERVRPRVRAAQGADAEPDADAPFVPETPDEEALAAVAGAAGAGLVECPVPDGAPEGLRSALSRSVRRGATVTAMVTDPEGLTAIYPPLPSFEQFAADPEAGMRAHAASQVSLGVWRWGDAWPGAEGWCTLEPPGKVVLAGVVRPSRADARPDEMRLVGCAPQPTSLDAEFRFELTVDRGEPCKLEVGLPGFEGTWVDRAVDHRDLVLAQPDSPHTVDELADALDARTERDARMPSPVEVALEGELSPAARAVLERWRDQERTALERQRHVVDVLDGVVAPQVEVLGASPPEPARGR